MTTFMAGLAIFLGIHSLRIFADGQRTRLIATLGPAAYKGLYAGIAIIGFVLIVLGYDDARAALPVVWQPPVFMRHIAATLMLPAMILLVASKTNGFIARKTRHPMLAGTKLWALAHLLANGSGVHIVLFGSFLAWAVLDRISVKKRAGIEPHSAPSRRGDIIAVVGGVILWALFAFYLHAVLFGVAPFG